MATDPSTLGTQLSDAVGFLAETFQSKGIRYAVVGGLGVIIRGRPRFTQDVDVLLEVPQLALPGLLDELVTRGFTLDTATVVTDFVRHHMAAFWFGNVRIDWLKPVLPLYSRTLTDAGDVSWGEVSLRVATAEGLILTKMVAFRSQDQADIETLVIANRATLDVALIRAEWAPFADKEPQRTSWLESVLTAHVAG